MWSDLIIENMILIGIACIVVFFIRVYLIKKKRGITKLKEITKKEYFDIFWLALFVAYTISVLNITCFSRFNNLHQIVYRIVHRIMGDREIASMYGGVNFLPFKGIERMLENIVYGDYLGIEKDFLIGNILLFLPFGFLVPLVFKKCNKYYKEIIASILGVLVVELIQFALVSGSFDIDDFIYNIIGGIIGFGLYLIFAGLFIDKENRIKSMIKGVIPIVLFFAVIISIKVVYNNSEYGIMPGVYLYKSKACKDVKNELDLSDESYEDYVYTLDEIKFDKTNLETMPKGIFSYLGTDYKQDVIKEDPEDEGYISDVQGKYISNDGKYTLEVEKDNGFSLCFNDYYEKYEKELDCHEIQPGEEEKKMNIDDAFIKKYTQYALDICKSSGVNITDRYYLSIAESYPQFGLEFYGYKNNNKKIVKRLGINFTQDGELACIFLNNTVYKETNKKIKIISEKEAFEKLQKGYTDRPTDYKSDLKSVSLIWLESSKDYYFPVYQFASIGGDRTMNDWMYYQVQAWEFE